MVIIFKHDTQAPNTVPPPLRKSINGTVDVERSTVGCFTESPLDNWRSITTNQCSDYPVDRVPYTVSLSTSCLYWRETYNNSQPTPVRGACAQSSDVVAQGCHRTSRPPSYLGGFFSIYFLVTKKDGGFRLILDLRNLNQFLPFRMLRTTNVLQAVIRQDWFMTIDLKDAYFHVPEHRRFLQFDSSGFFLLAWLWHQGCSQCLFRRHWNHSRVLALELLPYLDD